MTKFCNMCIYCDVNMSDLNCRPKYCLCIYMHINFSLDGTLSVTHVTLIITPVYEYNCFQLTPLFQKKH